MRISLFSYRGICVNIESDTQTHTKMHARLCVCVYVRSYIYIYCVHILYVRMHAWMYICINVHMNVRIYRCTHILSHKNILCIFRAMHIHKGTHASIHTCSSFPLFLRRASSLHICHRRELQIATSWPCLAEQGGCGSLHPLIFFRRFVLLIFKVRLWVAARSPEPF